MTAGTIPEGCETQEGRDELRRWIIQRLDETLARPVWADDDLESGDELVEGLNELDALEPAANGRCDWADARVTAMFHRLSERREQLSEEDGLDPAGFETLGALAKLLGQIAVYQRARS